MKFLIDKAQRLWKIPQPSLGPMKFARRRLDSRGVELIDLGSFIPELPDALARGESREGKSSDDPHRDESVIELLREKIAENHLPLRAAALNPDREIIITPGIQMTASLLSLAILNPGEVAAYPDPGMPHMRTATCLADGSAAPYTLAERNDYIPNIASLTQPPKKKLKMIFLNYPHNPTTSTTDTYFYRELIDAIRFENILVVSDAAYVHPGDGNAASILQVKGSKKKAVELHSFSTTFGMKGLGFATGHRDVISILKSILEAVGFVPPPRLVRSAADALDHCSELFEIRIKSLAERRDLVSFSLKELGWRIRGNECMPFVWVKPPARSSSLAFARRLVTKAGVRVAPGTDFGEAGEGWLRITLHPDMKTLRDALERISRHSRIWQRKYRPGDKSGGDQA